MTRVKGWRIGVVVFILFVATAIAAPAQTFTSLASFDGFDGSSPWAGVVQGADGNFYGTTSGGGNGGSIFKITATGTLTYVYKFCNRCSEGDAPYAGLVLATDGNFYGTTMLGGGYTTGTVFKITPADTLTTLHRFRLRTGGMNPQAALVQATDGNFYGTTVGGGSYGAGTVFKITPAGKLTTLYSFCSQANCPDGYQVYAGLVQGRDGNFYGTTWAGGNNYCYGGCGTIFKITPTGTLTTLYRFCTQTGCSDGAFVAAGLVQATDGNFYGTTAAYGGPSGGGTVFKITSGGKLTTLYSFCSQTNCADGDYPVAGLVQATDGNFYGTTELHGGNNSCAPDGCGTIFQMTPAGTLTTLHSFDQTDGSRPFARLLQATNGNFYGTTYGGGTNSCSPDGCGTVYSLATGLGPFVSFVRGSGKVGWKVEILGQGFTGTTGVSFNGTAANFVVQSDTYLKATIPQGATTGFVTVKTPGSTLQSNAVFRVTK
jgi:uncharacterized repeat protein (TIGR03803 family)